MTELDRLGVAAVLAANPDLEVRAQASPPIDADLDQLSDAVGIERGKRVV